MRYKKRRKESSRKKQIDRALFEMECRRTMSREISTVVRECDIGGWLRRLVQADGESLRSNTTAKLIASDSLIPNILWHPPLLNA
jgi:hypothetical protein